MPIDIEIRDALPADAPAACGVLRRSIIELCIADHRNDPDILRRWLSNKTPAIVASWIGKSGNSVLVAISESGVLSVGAVTDAGEITLNYVSPDARFAGVSRAMLRALEARALERGNNRCSLISTATARRFYHDAGYTEDRPAQGKFGTVGSYPMSKTLAEAAAKTAVRLVAVAENLPPGFDQLRDDARAEGYRFLDRLADDWIAGTIRFDRPGEMLLAADANGILAAIGGLTVDPVVPNAFRMRRFYVRRQFRGSGIGRCVAAALLASPLRDGHAVTVNAAIGSTAFWEAIGFVPDPRDAHTHLLQARHE